MTLHMLQAYKTNPTVCTYLWR